MQSYSSNTEARSIVQQIALLDQIYSLIFFQLEENKSLTEEDEASIEKIKSIHEAIYHLTWAFVHECKNAPEKAIISYANAQAAYLDKKQEFHDFQSKYKSFIANNLKSYKDELLSTIGKIGDPSPLLSGLVNCFPEGLPSEFRNDFYSENDSDEHKMIPNPQAIFLALKKLEENIDAVEECYQKKCREIIAELNSIPGEQLSNPEAYATTIKLVRELYQEFESAGEYAINLLALKFSKINLTIFEASKYLRVEDVKEDKMEEEKEVKSPLPTQKKPWLISEFLSLEANQIFPFIKSMSDSLINKKTKQNLSDNNNVSDMSVEPESNEVQRLQRRILKAKRISTMDSEPTNIISPALLLMPPPPQRPNNKMDDDQSYSRQLSKHHRSDSSSP